MKTSTDSGRSLHSETGSTLRVVLIVITLIGSLIFTVVGNFFENGGGELLSNLSKVVFHNFGFWIMLVVAAGFGIYRKLTNPETFLWSELPIQLGVSSLVLLGLYCLFFSTSTDLVDTEIWNGYVRRAEYYEAWTEKTTHTDSKGKKHTSYTRHPPHWVLETTAGKLSIESSAYGMCRGRFGNETKKNLYHMNQSSIGDGNMFYVVCDSNPNDLIPASRPHSYVNYLRASDSIKKIRGNIAGFETHLRPYPTVHGSDYGEIEFDRVIVSGAKVPEGWINAVDGKLDHALMRLSASKEVNIVIYIANTSDRKFASAVRESWSQGKKNDVVVIVGAPQFPKVSWVEVVSWTKVEEFPITLRNRVTEMGDITKTKEFTDIIIEEVSKPGSQGGYVRRSMSEFEYLVSEITLPWWCQVLIVLLGGAVSWFTSVLLINNGWRTYTDRWSSSFAFRRAR